MPAERSAPQSQSNAIARSGSPDPGKIVEQCPARSARRATPSTSADLSDEAYQAQRDATRATLAELPDGDRITAFDIHRARLLALPDAIAAASPARREELARIVIERVVVHDRQVEAITWTPSARLGTLPTTVQAAIAMRFGGGFTAAEIAGAIGRSVPATEKMLSRALTSLRKELADVT